MSSKRKPIDRAALAAVAIPQPDPVAAAVQRVEEKPPPPRQAAPPRAAPKPGKGRAEASSTTPRTPSGSRQPSRKGKVGIQFWTDEETRKKLKHWATDNETTLDRIMTEALGDFMRKRGIG